MSTECAVSVAAAHAELAGEEELGEGRIGDVCNCWR